MSVGINIAIVLRNDLSLTKQKLTFLLFIS